MSLTKEQKSGLFNYIHDVVDAQSMLVPYNEYGLVSEEEYERNSEMFDVAEAALVEYINSL